MCERAAGASKHANARRGRGCLPCVRILLGKGDGVVVVAANRGVSAVDQSCADALGRPSDDRLRVRTRHYGAIDDCSL